MKGRDGGGSWSSIIIGNQGPFWPFQTTGVPDRTGSVATSRLHSRTMGRSNPARAGPAPAGVPPARRMPRGRFYPSRCSLVARLNRCWQLNLSLSPRGPGWSPVEEPADQRRGVGGGGRRALPNSALQRWKTPGVVVTVWVDRAGGVDDN